MHGGDLPTLSRLVHCILVLPEIVFISLRTDEPEYQLPTLAGGWVEAWRSLEMVDVYLDVNFMVDYAVHLGEAVTCSSLGYFLEVYRDKFSVKQTDLDILKAHRPRQPHYIQRDKRVPLKQYTTRKFISQWNIWIPIERFEQRSEFDTEFQT